jgi:hypothetical protein
MAGLELRGWRDIEQAPEGLPGFDVVADDLWSGCDGNGCEKTDVYPHPSQKRKEIVTATAFTRSWVVAVVPERGWPSRISHL